MKLVFANNETLEVETLNRNYRPNVNMEQTNLTFTTLANCDVETLVTLLTVENTKSITLVRDNTENVIFENYVLSNINEEYFDNDQKKLFVNMEKSNS